MAGLGRRCPSSRASPIEPACPSLQIKMSRDAGGYGRPLVGPGAATATSVAALYVVFVMTMELMQMMMMMMMMSGSRDDCLPRHHQGR